MNSEIKNREIEEGDVVLCTVDRIIGTIVFVKIDNLKNLEGSIVFSEVAPGRIRNIRDYVVPKKKIVCKVLRVSPERVDLSLRRVTQKEQKEIMEEYKQEKSYKNIFRSILGEKAKEVIQKIEEQGNFYDLIENAKTSDKTCEKIEKIVGKEETKKIFDIIKTQKKKLQIITKKFSLETTEPNGIEKIKEVLGKIKDSEIKYLSAGKYSIKKESEDIKKADQEIKESLKEIEKNCKKENILFNTLEK
ncbi:hypothetical protein K9L16_00605 [Candidatus Pacearchaeota archaeon]|nr:hypothetical protein [Candidatus Pacearchaeota archaeon]